MNTTECDPRLSRISMAIWHCLLQIVIEAGQAQAYLWLYWQNYAIWSRQACA